LNENTIRLISQKKKKQVFIRTDLKLLQKWNWP
jgi:hypothetical protein